MMDFLVFDRVCLNHYPLVVLIFLSVFSKKFNLILIVIVFGEKRKRKKNSTTYHSCFFL